MVLHLLWLCVAFCGEKLWYFGLAADSDFQNLHGNVKEWEVRVGISVDILFGLFVEYYQRVTARSFSMKQKAQDIWIICCTGEADPFHSLKKKKKYWKSGCFIFSLHGLNLTAACSSSGTREHRTETTWNFNNEWDKPCFFLPLSRWWVGDN